MEKETLPYISSHCKNGFAVLSTNSSELWLLHVRVEFSYSDMFLPAAKPTGLVEANSSSFFFLSSFFSDTSKEGLNSVTYVIHVTHYDSCDSL